MNKLFNKIAIGIASIAMAVGVGVAVGANKEAIPAEAASGTFTKITSAPSDWSGEYVIVYESGSTAYCWTGVDATSCYATATISSGSITGPASACTVTIATMTGGYSVKVNGGTNNGKYIKNASSNGIVFQTDAAATTFTYENNSVTMTCGGKNFRYNSNNDQKRFRYFGSAQQVIQLYKKASSNVTVTFNANGHGTAPDSQTFASGGKASEPTAPTATGWTFGGWYEEQACTNAWNFNTAITSNKTLYAKWTANTYNINYYDQGGSAFSGNHESGYPTQHTYGEDTTLKSASKTGYLFVGWFANTTCTGDVVTTLGATAYTAAINLYAKWDQITGVTLAEGTFSKTYSVNGVWDWEHLTVTYTTQSGGGGTATRLTFSDFSFSPSAPDDTSITSVTVSATYQGVTSDSITINGITVNEKQNLGGIVDGEKYFIIANGYYLGAFNSAPGAPAGTAKSWPGDESAPTSDDDAWLFTATSTDDNWIITSKAGNTLYATATNNGLGCTSNGNDNWTVHDTANGLKITASNGRYLTQYSGSNFRVYTSTTGQTEADSTVRFVKYEAPATIESVEFTGSMTKKAYYVGDSWDYSGLSLQANLSNETTQDLGTVASLIQSGDLEIEASPASPALNVTSVTISGLYGNNLLECETTITGITVSAPRTITGVAITGDMTNKSYSQGDTWDYTGLYMTVTYNQGEPDVVALSTAVSESEIEFTPSPATATYGTTSLTLGSIVHITFEGEISDKVITGITVSAVPGVINFGTTSGYWQPSLSGSTYVDNLENTATITSDSTSWNTRTATTQQVGSNGSPATYVLVSIALADRSGIDAVSVTFSSSGSNNVDLRVYGDTVDDIIVNGNAPGNSDVVVSTDAQYTKINADTLNIRFVPTKGVKITSISYTLGSLVQEFGTLSSIEVSSSSLHSTTFEIDHTFSTEGLIITATDTVGYKKDFTTGFTTDYDGVTFDEIESNIEVTVTMTIGQVTRTTSYFINVVEIPTYTLASSGADLYEGMTVIIAYVDGNNVYTAGALSGDYLTKVDGSVYEDGIRAGLGTYEFVVEYYGSNILLRHGANYLKHVDDKKITLSSILDESCVWEYDDWDEGTYLGPVCSESHYLQYNSASPRFTDYADTQKDVGLYISSATPASDALSAATYAQKYLHMRDYTNADGSCMDDSENHYYSTAKTEYGNLSAEEKVEFAKLGEAVARLQAWARANGESFDPSAKTFSKLRPISILNYQPEVTNTTLIIIVASIVSGLAVGGYFFLRKRKED